MNDADGDPAGGPGKSRHVAHAQGWTAICTAPDFCLVGKDVIAFNSFATLDQQHTASPNVKARGTAVYRQGDMFKNVQADAGKHVVSGTSLGNGYVKILDGHENVKVNGMPVARHDSRCLINCNASGLGGAQGKIVTEQKSAINDGGVASNPEAPAGERSSDRLEELKRAREQVSLGMLDFDAADEYVNFKQSNKVLDGLIGQISGTPGTATDYAAQAARGLLGFAKDTFLGLGEIGYEGVKAVPKLAQLEYTQSGRLYAQLDAQILAENIKLGNITPETVGRGALNIGKAIVKPVTDPWEKGQYVEAGTRGAAEIFTWALVVLKGAKAVQLAKATDAADVAKTAKVVEVAETTKAPKAAKAAEGVSPHADDGVHVKGERNFGPNDEPQIPEWKGPTDYTHITDPPNVTASHKPTLRQVREMKQANRAHNDGVLRDDVTGELMVDSKKSKSGIVPPSNEVQVDHIKPVAAKGTRAQSNLKLRTRKNNRAKSHKWEEKDE